VNPSRDELHRLNFSAVLGVVNKHTKSNNTVSIAHGLNRGLWNFTLYFWILITQFKAFYDTFFSQKIDFF
jgi:hypothetical protein